MAMTYFTIYTELMDVVDELEDAAAGRLLKGLLHYANGDDVFPDGEERLVLMMMCKSIDQHAKKYEEVCEKRRAAGAAGAARRWGDAHMANDSKSQQMLPNAIKAQHSVANIAKDKDEVKDKVKDEVKVKSKQTAARFVPPTLEDVKAYCDERGGKVDAQRWFDYYSSNGWRVGKNPMKDWKAAVRTWERNEYSAPAKAKTNPAAQYSQREYTETGMEALPDWMRQQLDAMK